jgi:hypothetical protein
VTERGDKGIAQIKELTNGISADSVLECAEPKNHGRAPRDQGAAATLRRVCVSKGLVRREEQGVMRRIALPVRILAMALVGITLACADGPKSAQGASDQQVRIMKIRMDVEGTVITATLVDSATSRDFVSLLPLTLTLKDYAGTEKISDLPRRLSTEGAPPGSDPSIGDITYYSPWGNLAMFYRDFGYSNGLIKLGTIDSGVEALNRPGPLRATIELVKK